MLQPKSWHGLYQLDGECLNTVTRICIYIYKYVCANTGIQIYIHTCIYIHSLHCITLHYIALHYSTLHTHILTLHSLHCITLHYIALHCITLHYITKHYKTFHYIHTYIHTYMHACMHTYIHTYIHYIHSYIHFFFCAVSRKTRSPFWRVIWRGETKGASGHPARVGSVGGTRPRRGARPW